MLKNSRKLMLCLSTFSYILSRTLLLLSPSLKICLCGIYAKAEHKFHLILLYSLALSFLYDNFSSYISQIFTLIYKSRESDKNYSPLNSTVMVTIMVENQLMEIKLFHGKNRSKGPKFFLIFQLPNN